ncbi:MAG TPA: DUF2059 domain-containing protein [Candidatus Acidoferrales bacterium]|nr:DUF2059 domain-containing protein [Candidatus Acidoferrales bacterium]
MRAFAAMVLFLMGTSVQAGQNQYQVGPVPPPAVAPAAQAKIDPAKEADIRRLLEATGTTTLMQQVMDNMQKSLKPVLTNSFPPGEYREKLVDLFFEKFRSKLDTKRLVDLAVIRYDEQFSDDDIKGLISFYETPLGQKAVSALPKLTVELQQDGQALGQQMGRESMIEVLAEHPELAKALQDAGQGTPPPSK